MNIEDAEIKTSGDIEELAAQYGWHADGEKSAEDFIKVAMDKFPDQNKKIKQLFRTVEELKVHMTKTEQLAYDRARKDLDEQRRQAIKQGDVDLVEEIDQAKDDLKSSLESVPTQNDDVHPAIIEFEERNKKWLDGTSFEELKMQKWVEAHGAVLGKKRLPPDQHMKLLDDHVRKEFPDYFEEDTPISPVSSSAPVASIKSAKGKKFSFNDLSAEQKQIARDFEAVGFMKVEDYIKNLISHGELK